MIKIGIVGCGTIGSSLGKAIQKRFSQYARVAYVSDIFDEQIKKFRKKVINRSILEISVKELVEKSDFIIEAACPDVAKAMILSVGGVIQIKNLERLLQKSRGCIYIPSGAIAGVDALLACKGASIKRVRITTRKPVRSLLGAPFMKKAKNELNKIRK